MSEILRPEQVAKKLGLTEMSKFRRKFGDRKKHSRKYSGENIGQVKSQILRLQKSIRKLEPEVTDARDKFEKSDKPVERLEYLQINNTLINKEKSLLKAQHEYDRIIRERIEEIEGPASEEEK